MKKSVLYLLLVLPLFFTIAGCEDLASEPEVPTDNKPKDTLQSEQLVYFQVVYRNYAWGFQHNGYYIDAKGNAHRYNLPATWIGCDSLSEISAEDLKKNLEQCDSIVPFKLQLDLQEKILLIDRIDQSNISTRTNRGADMGACSYFAFTYNNETKKYKRIFLETIGDWSYKNESLEAIELCNWLYNGNPPYSINFAPVIFLPPSDTTLFSTYVTIQNSDSTTSTTVNTDTSTVSSGTTNNPGIKTIY